MSKRSEKHPPDVIHDHYQHPRNYGALVDPTLARRGLNPLCGDEVTLTVRLEGECIRAIGFTARGCSIVQASASILSELVTALSVQESEAVRDRVVGVLLHSDSPGDDEPELVALGGVRMYPARIKCALLPWDTLAALLGSRSQDDVQRHGIVD